MTKKHFELIASVLKKHLAYCDDQAGKFALLPEVLAGLTVHKWNEREKALQAVVASLAAEFESVNPRFNVSRFMKACQPEVVKS